MTRAPAPTLHVLRRALATVLATVLAPVVGAVVAMVWRRRAAPRHETVGEIAAGIPGAEGREGHEHGEDGAGIQGAERGNGPLVHRRYDIVLEGVTLVPAELLRLVRQHLTELAPSALADFVKSHGEDMLLAVGDEYQITMLGPWNGAVRVVEVGRQSFTLVTLDGHPEAGHITFSVRHDIVHPGACTVRVESWARARNALVRAAYSLGPGQQMQTEVWVTFLQRVAALVGIGTPGTVEITTESHAHTAPLLDG